MKRRPARLIYLLCVCVYVCVFQRPRKHANEAGSGWTHQFAIRVCMYVCMYVCMHACVCACFLVVFESCPMKRRPARLIDLLCACVCVCIYVCVHVSLWSLKAAHEAGSIYIHRYIHTCNSSTEGLVWRKGRLRNQHMCVCACLSVCLLLVYIRIHVYIYIYIYIYIHTYIHRYIHTWNSGTEGLVWRKGA